MLNKQEQMARFTINEFREQYSTEDVCLDHIFKIRYGSLDKCPHCNQKSNITRVTGRRSYQCSRCRTQFYPTKDTIFEKSTTPLVNWLYVIYLFTTTRNGVAAKEIQRQLGVTYKCAWRMGHQVRILMGGDNPAMLSGIIEADETFVGGKVKNMHNKKKKELKKGRGSVNKTTIFGMLERGVGVRAVVLNTDAPTGKILKPIILSRVESGSTMVTDGFGGYKDLNLHYQHEVVNHSGNEYVRGNFHTNGIEGFWSQVKRTIGGTHIQVSRKYLQLYVNESIFRYNNVFKGERMFYAILKNLPVVKNPNQAA